MGGRNLPKKGARRRARYCTSRRGREELKITIIAKLWVAVGRDEILETFINFTERGWRIEHSVPMTNGRDVWDRVSSKWDTRGLKCAQRTEDIVRWSWQLHICAVKVLTFTEQIEISIIAVEVLEVVLELVLTWKGVGEVWGLAIRGNRPRLIQIGDGRVIDLQLVGSKQVNVIGVFWKVQRILVVPSG